MMRTFISMVAAVMFCFGALGRVEGDLLDLTQIPGVAWEHTGGGSNPEFSHDDDMDTAWTSSYNSHEVGNIDLVDTLWFPDQVHVDSIFAKVTLRASSRSFQAGGSDQGRTVDVELLYKTCEGAEFLRVPHPDAHERQQINQNDGESSISWERWFEVDLDSVEALRLRASVASYTNEANAADGSVLVSEFSAVGVPEPSTLSLAACGALALLGVRRWRRARVA